MVTGDTSYKVSIILATYNSSSFLERSVKSVLRQTFQEIELIVVDDGSTDGTFEILYPFLVGNNNMKYIRHSNRKHPLSLNAGILNSIGSYITFIDADDEYLPDHIRLRVDFMNSNRDVDLLHSPALLRGEEDDFLIPDAKDLSKLIHINDCIIGGTLFGKREMFIQSGGFRNMYSHDSDFVGRVESNFRVCRFDSPTYVYHRDNPASVTSRLRRSV